MCQEDTSGKKKERGMHNFVWCNIHWCTLIVCIHVSSKPKWFKIFFRSERRIKKGYQKIIY